MKLTFVPIPFILLEEFVGDGLFSVSAYGRSKAEPFVYIVVKHLNAEGFEVTVYPTRRMVGDLIWKES